MSERGRVRRILVCFAFVIVLAPLTALGGWWTLGLAAALVFAACALRDALVLRRAAHNS